MLNALPNNIELTSEKRLFAIGDIHGCALELETLLEKLRIRSDDIVVFLGDYIDRGPNSRRVIDLILDLSKRCEVVALKGNHEAMFTEFLEHPESSGAALFVLNGGSSTLASYGSVDGCPAGSFEIPDTHLEFYKSLRLYFETDSHFFVHAGVPIRPLGAINPASDEDALLWSRQPFLSTDYRWEKVIVHGHTPVFSGEVRPNRVNLDTGCVYDGFLTALELPSGQFHRVEKGLKNEKITLPRALSPSRISMRFAGKVPVTAIRPGGDLCQFETLNYNQFGLLITDVKKGERPHFKKGDQIEGRIGPKGKDSILFAGIVVRLESRGEVNYYGVQINRITNGGDGKTWIERPAV